MLVLKSRNRKLYEIQKKDIRKLELVDLLLHRQHFHFAQ